MQNLLQRSNRDRRVALSRMHLRRDLLEASALPEGARIFPLLFAGAFGLQELSFLRNLVHLSSRGLLHDSGEAQPVEMVSLTRGRCLVIGGCDGQGLLRLKAVSHKFES